MLSPAAACLCWALSPAAACLCRDQCSSCWDMLLLLGSNCLCSPLPAGEHKIQRGYVPSLTYSLHYMTNPGFAGVVAR